MAQKLTRDDVKKWSVEEVEEFIGKRFGDEVAEKFVGEPTHDTLHSWCSKWKLSLNSKKCAAIYASLLTIINIYCQWSSNSTSS